MTRLKRFFILFGLDYSDCSVFRLPAHVKIENGVDERLMRNFDKAVFTRTDVKVDIACASQRIVARKPGERRDVASLGSPRRNGLDDIRRASRTADRN